jgi:methylated-DNA-[protein]-cysteine S-methyltransferase
MKRLVVPSPVGPLTLVSDKGKLVGCYFSNSDFAKQKLAECDLAPSANDAVLKAACKELELFFAGSLKKFTIPVAPSGTDFQRLVWKALQKIPFGRTASYGDIAKQVGNPGAMRAVGAANGKNPICIIIPCHRVIGADGSLTGFGGGIERKKYLLGLERGKLSLPL